LDVARSRKWWTQSFFPLREWKSVGFNFWRQKLNRLCEERGEVKKGRAGTG
jgi:hypothetical protein